jgi:hypothetical protein
MTKFFGSLVGTPKQANRPVNVPSNLERGTDHILNRDTVTLAAAAINDTVQLAILPWETQIDPIGSDLYFAALGAGTFLQVGDITFPLALTAATATNAAGSVKIGAALAIGNYFGKPLWQVLGYATLAAAKLIGTQAELLIKLTGGVGTGAVTWQLRGRQQ